MTRLIWNLRIAGPNRWQHWTVTFVPPRSPLVCRSFDFRRAERTWSRSSSGRHHGGYGTASWPLVGISPEFWLHLQKLYELRMARQEIGRALQEAMACGRRLWRKGGSLNG